MCLAFAFRIAMLCYESIVQVIPISRLLGGSIVGAIGYCDVYCPRHKQKRPVIRTRYACPGLRGL